MISSNIDSAKLIKALNQFPTNIQKNVMNGAVRAGANVIGNKAKTLVPKDTGTLRKSLGTTKRKSKDKAKIHFSVSPRVGGKNSGWYGRFVEFGTSKMTAKPFLRPAFEMTEKEALEATKEYIAKRIPKEVEKAKKWLKVI